MDDKSSKGRHSSFIFGRGRGVSGKSLVVALVWAVAGRRVEGRPPKPVADVPHQPRGRVRGRVRAGAERAGPPCSAGAGAELGPGDWYLQDRNNLGQFRADHMAGTRHGPERQSRPDGQQSGQQGRGRGRAGQGRAGQGRHGMALLGQVRPRAWRGRSGVTWPGPGPGRASPASGWQTSSRADEPCCSASRPSPNPCGAAYRSSPWH